MGQLHLHLAQGLFGPLALGNVLDRPKQAAGPARRIPCQITLTVNDAQLAVGPDHAVLQVAARGATQRLRRGLAPDRPILGVYPLPHFGKSDRAFTRRQPKDAVGFVGPGDAICVEVTFPVADMRDALSFFELSLAPTQTLQRLLETRSHESESLREQADLIVSPDLGHVSPVPL